MSEEHRPTQEVVHRLDESTLRALKDLFLGPVGEGNTARKTTTNQEEAGSVAIPPTQEQSTPNVTVNNNIEASRNWAQTVFGAGFKILGVTACFTAGAALAYWVSPGTQAALKGFLTTASAGPSPMLSKEWRLPKDKSDSMNPNADELDKMSQIDPAGCLNTICIVEIGGKGDAVIIVPGGSAADAVIAVNATTGGCAALKTSAEITGKLQTADGTTLTLGGGVTC